MCRLNVFDFDNTIYDGDSSIDFYIFCLKSNPLLIRYLPIQLYGMIMYKLKIKNKEYFKEKYFSFLKGVKDINGEITRFWKLSIKKIKYDMIKEKDRIVIISASPEFLIEPIKNEINAEKIIATIVDKKTGKFLSKNCYGEEKVERLKREYKSYKIAEFYSDSLSDKYLAEISIKAFLVKKSEVNEWNI